MLKVKVLQPYLRPRERLFNFGGESLSDLELLAIILRLGGKDTSVFELAATLLFKYKSLTNLFSCNPKELLKIKNLGYSKVAVIAAINQIFKRINVPSTFLKFSIACPQDIYDLLKPDLYGKTVECFFVISLNSKNQVIAKDLVSVGTLTESLVHPREVFFKAIINNAYSIIICHNHPSNVSTPSNADIFVTQKIVKAGDILKIKVLDHLIFCNDSYASLKALNLMYSKGGDK